MLLENTKKLLAIVAVIVVMLLFATSLQQDKTQTNSRGPGPSDDVPELADILHGDEETQLNAARDLTRRVGVTEALEILNASTLPKTGQGHLVVHQVGFEAYREHGIEAIKHCKDYFLYACYHGAIIEAAGDQGIKTIAEMAATCEDSPSRHFQCSHAVGHALLALWNYDVPPALNDCDKIFADRDDFPLAKNSCHNGVFMENIYGVHDYYEGQVLKRDWLSDDPYFPCNAVGDDYQEGCWLNQASRMYGLVQGDFSAISQLCLDLDNRQHLEWCMNSLARQIHPETNGDPAFVYGLCSEVDSSWQDYCINTNATAYATVGDPGTAMRVCQEHSSESNKTICIDTLTPFLTTDTRTLEQ